MIMDFADCAHGDDVSECHKGRAGGHELTDHAEGDSGCACSRLVLHEDARDGEAHDDVNENDLQDMDMELVPRAEERHDELWCWTE
jgi:hypothetical protein